MYYDTICFICLLDETMKTIDEIEKAVQEGTLRSIGPSMWRGYVSRKGKVSTAYPYKGKYGSGYCVYRPNWESTRYSFITYYVFN
jgi:hypothetical protein